jgi:mitochondrial cardiolipin hydrolase
MIDKLKEIATVEAVFSRTASIAAEIERLVASTRACIDAALYRITSGPLARALEEASKRGVRVRLILDRGRFESGFASQELLTKVSFPFRIAYGRDGSESKMHHKFALLDDSMLLSGSYNWTFASEERNHENLLILREPKLVDTYRQEFEALWADAREVAQANEEILVAA